MPKAASARRYAQAVFQLAQEKGDLDQWLEELVVLARAVENRELAALLDAPQVPLSQKLNVINNTFGSSIDKLLANLISLLASRNTAYVVPEIVTQYQRLLDAYRGIEQAEVVSAVLLDDAQKQKVEVLLKSIVNKEIRITSRVDPQLLGGFVARVGDKVIDGSTATQFVEMRRELVQQHS